VLSATATIFMAITTIISEVLIITDGTKIKGTSSALSEICQ
jgi:hypothetical protein